MKNLITCLVVCVMSSVTFADTWTVDDDGKADFDNIQAAVYAASDGDEILVMPGTYTSTADEVVDMLGKEIWLHSSAGAEVTIIDGEGARRGIICGNGETSNTIIEGFTITNCYANTGGGGGGMYNYESSPTLTNCTFTNNTADGEGGGMRNSHNSNPTLTNCTFTNNYAYNFGGGMYNLYSSSPTLIDCTFTDNTAPYGGGMRNSNSSPTLTNCTFTNNSAYNGGGILNYQSSTMLTDTTVCGNTPDQISGDWTDGGGNYVADECEVQTFWTVDDDGKADFDNIQDAIDASSDGDEIIVMPGTYTSAADEVVDMRGKEIWLHSNKGAEVTIIDGEGARRGIICGNGETPNAIIEGFTITNCYANTGGGGGGMYNWGSSPVLTNCTFTNNTADDEGGGMRNSHNSNPTLTNCTFTNNYAYNFGGGVYNLYSSSPTLIDCTFTDNTAPYGGGMCNYLSIPTLTNCTFTNNSAYNGGGIFNSQSSTMLTDTTVCGNTPDQISGDWTDNGGNTIADECPIDCPDINGDGYVNVSDLLAVIDQWGLTNSPADVNQDGIVDVTDLLIVVGNWGPCE